MKEVHWESVADDDEGTNMLVEWSTTRVGRRGGDDVDDVDDEDDDDGSLCH